MRLAHSYIDGVYDSSAQVVLPSTVQGFARQMNYDNSVSSREEFIRKADLPWINELHAELVDLLDPSRSVLSVGSGKGEHEVKLGLKGFKITASDIVIEALDEVKHIFPEVRCRYFNVLDPDLDIKYEDLLATGLDPVLDDDQLRIFFSNAKTILQNGGRVILVHRFNDNIATKIIDNVLVPLWATARRIYHRFAKTDVRVVRREHGFRRTRTEIVNIAEDSGWRLERVRYAAFGMEAARVPCPKALMKAIRAIDRRIRVFNSATVFEFLPK